MHRLKTIACSSNLRTAIERLRNFIQGSLEKLGPGQPPSTPVPNISPTHTRHVYVNLRRLAKRTDRSLEADAKYMSTQPPTNRPFVALIVDRVEIDPKHKKMFALKEEPQPVRRPIKSVRQFFGPVVSTSPEPSPRTSDDAKVRAAAEEDIIPRIEFRIQGQISIHNNFISPHKFWLLLSCAIRVQCCTCALQVRKKR